MNQEKNGHKQSRRTFCRSAAAATLGLGLCGLNSRQSDAQEPSSWLVEGGQIKVGLLWSLTGVLSVTEKSLRDVALFWIEQVNKSGGIAGMEVVPVEIDAKSDMAPYREGAKHLIDTERVLAIFGGWTSISRRAVMPIVTLRDHLFYYPTQYEGRECWQNIICTGPLANQQVFELVPYMVKHCGPRAYFVGSNYIWPKESNRNAEYSLIAADGELVGESYVPLGLGDFDGVLKEIKNIQPDWIFSVVVGDSDVYFRKAYIDAGLTPDEIPTATLSTSEAEVQAMGYDFGDGHYISAPYFQSIDTVTNIRFVEQFLSSKYGEAGVTHTNMVSVYLSLTIFKKVLEIVIAQHGIENVTPRLIRNASAGVSLSDAESPQGVITIDPNNFNSWVTPRIGRFNSAGQVDIVYNSGTLVEPKPFLLYPDRGTCLDNGLHLPNGKIVEAAS
jgi:urea transport system substrate-binding protein